VRTLPQKRISRDSLPTSVNENKGIPRRSLQHQGSPNLGRMFKDCIRFSDLFLVIYVLNRWGKDSYTISRPSRGLFSHILVVSNTYKNVGSFFYAAISYWSFVDRYARIFGHLLAVSLYTLSFWKAHFNLIF
jgi:hypothetical protein